jgi:hypothetical protein
MQGGYTMKNQFTGILSVTVFTFIFFLIAAGPGYAADYQTLTPLLIDLNGWNAEAANGISLDTGNQTIHNAGREYTHGDKEIQAIIFIGPQAMSQGQMDQMKAGKAPDHLNLTKIDGFDVTMFYDEQENTTTIMVFLSQNQQSGAFLALTCEGLEQDESINIAKQFDWNAMKAAAENLF